MLLLTLHHTLSFLSFNSTQYKKQQHIEKSILLFWNIYLITFPFLVITTWRIYSPPRPYFLIFHQNVAFMPILFYSEFIWCLSSSVWVPFPAQNGPQSCCVSSLAASQCSRHLSVTISSSVIDVHTKASLCWVCEPVVLGCSLITVEVMNEMSDGTERGGDEANSDSETKTQRGVVVWMIAVSAFCLVGMTKLQLSVLWTIILIWKQRSFT